jgi:predicted acyl esterase
MQIADDGTQARGSQAMVPMRDGARLNTFVFLPGSGSPRGVDGDHAAAMHYI